MHTCLLILKIGFSSDSRSSQLACPREKKKKNTNSRTLRKICVSKEFKKDLGMGKKHSLQAAEPWTFIHRKISQCLYSSRLQTSPGNVRWGANGRQVQPPFSEQQQGVQVGCHHLVKGPKNCFLSAVCVCVLQIFLLWPFHLVFWIFYFT